MGSPDVIFAVCIYAATWQFLFVIIESFIPVTREVYIMAAGILVTLMAVDYFAPNIPFLWKVSGNIMPLVGLGVQAAVKAVVGALIEAANNANLSDVVGKPPNVGQLLFFLAGILACFILCACTNVKVDNWNIMVTYTGPLQFMSEYKNVSNNTGSEGQPKRRTTKPCGQ